MERIRKKVSCHVITYNHINYISKCLDGILMQKTNFDFEIVIGDDLSTDGTREIIQQYADKYPDKVKLNLRTVRGTGIPGKENFTSTLNLCHGEYISLCDGDDYWTDPLKLQKQVDFLEANPDYVLCFHDVKILKSDGEIVRDFITKVPESYELRKTLVSNYNYIHTASVVFRNVSIDYSTIEFSNSPIGDYFLYVILSQYGKIGYLKEIMAIYRHGSGIYSKIDGLKHSKTNLLMYLNLYSYEKDPEVKEIFYHQMLNFLNPLYESCRKNEIILQTRRHDLIEKLYWRIRNIFREKID